MSDNEMIAFDMMEVSYGDLIACYGLIELCDSESFDLMYSINIDIQKNIL